MFNRMIAILVLSAASVGATASSVNIDTSGLSEAQVAELKAIAAKKVAETSANAAKSTEGGTTEKMTAGVTLAATWGTQAAAAAEGFSRAISIAARELGVTVNDFLHTDAGKLTALLIIWKVAGATAVKMLYGMLFVTIGLTVARMLWIRLFTHEYKEVTYSRFFGTFTGTKLVRVPKNISQLSSDGEWLALWMIVIIIIASVAIGSVFF